MHIHILYPCYLLSVLHFDCHTFKLATIIFLPSFLPYQIYVLVNTLNLVDSPYLSVYIWSFPTVPVVYLYIIRQRSKELYSSPERTMKRKCNHSQTSLFIQQQSYRAPAKWECALWFSVHHILPIRTQIVLFSHSVFVLTQGLWIMMTVWKVSNREERTRKSH